MKKYGSFVAVDDCTLNIEDGTFVTLLGPSGCGKTTVLRSIAGFFPIDRGEIKIGKTIVASADRGILLPPEKRNVGMVFQSYAVWPHMNVFDNIAYPLRLRGVTKREIKRQVFETLDLLQLTGQEYKTPAQLSGGQQQRVALGRAVIMQPQVLLLDEPLSNLDAQLRESMRFELKQLQRHIGITIVYVTHDQEEAMALSDKIVVMREGKIQQIGTPRDIYDKPSNHFVAKFLGNTNFLPVRIREHRKNSIILSVDGTKHTMHLNHWKSDCGEFQSGDRIVIGFRYHDVNLTDRIETKNEIHDALLPGTCKVPGRIEAATFMGDSMLYQIDIFGHKIISQNSPSNRYEAGLPVQVTIDSVFLFKEKEKSLQLSNYSTDPTVSPPG